MMDVVNTHRLTDDFADGADFGADGYDLIGDVHGCAETLARLLEQLGYRKRQGIYQHPRRRAIFVGDIVDRGPRIREALHLVREMVERGSARLILGNHEYNALCYATPAGPDSGREYLRAHTPHNTRLLSATLEQFAHYPRDWQDFLDWFLVLPLFLDAGQFRVVHACWDSELINLHRQRYPHDHLDVDYLHAAAVAGSLEQRTIQRLTSGIDMPLPDGEVILSRDGAERYSFRARFWAEDPQTYGDLVFQPDPLPPGIAERPIDEAHRAQLVTYGPEQPPLFVGHYWLTGTPAPITPNIACLDYSAVKYGRLVAYRLTPGETCLDPGNFVWVSVDP